MTKRPSDYRVVISVGEAPVNSGPAADMEAQVRELLKEGWEPQGGVTVDTRRRADGSVYCACLQVMVKLS